MKICLFQLLAGLGYVIFQALDFSIDEEEERAISSQLERILNFMIQKSKFKHFIYFTFTSVRKGLLFHEEVMILEED